MVGEHADGDGEMLQQDIVLKIEAEIAAPVLIYIICVVTRHFVFVSVCFRDFFSETCGEDVLTTELNANSGLAECPCGVGIGVGTIDIGLMEILIGLGIGSSPDIVVEGTVPV